MTAAFGLALHEVSRRHLHLIKITKQMRTPRAASYSKRKARDHTAKVK